MTKQMTFDHITNMALASRLGVVMVLTAFIAACATTELPPQSQTPRPSPVADIPDLPELPDLPEGEDGSDADTPDSPKEITPGTVVTRDGLIPPHMQGRDVKRLALLLPFSAKSERLRAEANSMMQAAEMAVFQRDNPDALLIALDTAGTARGAQAAVKSAEKLGADVILGPILARSVRAASRQARQANIPVIAFSTDQSVAGNGTYLLSFPPEAEVQRIVNYARSTGVTRFAYIGPESAYGDRVKTAYAQRVRETGGTVTATETYDGDDITVMDAPARRLSQVFAKVETENEARQEQGLPPDPLAFEAIILPEGGTALRSLAPPLLYYEDGMSNVQFLGTGLWHREDTVREPALSGGVFAGPDQEPRDEFLTAFDRTYGEDPSRLASLAFDAVNFGVMIADGDPRGRRARVEDPQGFYGADGLVIFRADGTPNRGLAVYQIQNGRFRIIDPAPRVATGTN